MSHELQQKLAALESRNADLRDRLEEAQQAREEALGDLHAATQRHLAHVAGVAKERDEAQRVANGYLLNVGSCAACVECIACGSTMHAHEGCAIAERDALRVTLEELKCYIGRAGNPVARMMIDCALAPATTEAAP